MTEGTSQGLFIVVAIVIFGIFVGLVNTLFGSQGLSNDLKVLFEDVLYEYQYEVTDESYFKIDSNGVLLGFSEKGYEEEPVNIVIPEQINGITVTSIGEFAFDTHSVTQDSTINFLLESVVIPHTVTRIELEAFSNNLLTELTLPNNLEHIGRHAFDNSKLTELVIPDSVKFIARQSFYGNPLKDLYLGKQLEFIGAQAFSKHQLDEIYIPSSVQQIDRLAFDGVTVLTVYLPNELSDWMPERTISVEAFEGGTEFRVYSGA